MTLAEALAQVQARGLPRLEAQMLLLHALDRPSHARAWLLAHDREPLPPEAGQRLRALTTRRLAGEPIAYLIGSKAFHGLELQIDARVLDPRDDTETLVDWALELLPSDQASRVLDLGTGSGAIALAIAQQRPRASVLAVDASTDALAVVVSSENDFATDVTIEELGKIFSSKVTNWSDVRPEWPNEPIQRFSPGTDSGTFDYFVEVVMGPLNPNAEGKADIEAGKADLLAAANTQFSEDDNVLVLGVEGSKYAIGYFGYAYYVENQGNLKTLAINGIEPNATTAEDGTYPLARPLFIYSDATILKDKPQVADFIDFFLTNVNDEISAVGYFPASEEALNASRQALADALK